MPDRSIQAVLKDGLINHSHIIETTGSTLEADPLLAELATLIEDADDADVREAVLWALNSPECEHVGEALQYFGHVFRWEWLRTEIQQRFDEATSRHDLRAMRSREWVLEAFEDDWEDLELYPSLEARAAAHLVLVPRGNVRFFTGATPVLVVAGAPIHEALPVLTMSDGVASRCDGWTLRSLMTVCVVDGPGDLGCAIQTAIDPRDLHDADVHEAATWCDDVDAAGGALVISLPDLPASFDRDRIYSAGFARGGTIRNAIGA
ncbi:hypothetical protein ACIP5Y_26390 [Nocardia sp. NPDC088792]|uniref:hypothetical protein n=1 Tax=Nocardia sp. NPDC088792 TaxID=3364332 RepID=UPI0037F9BF3B